MADQPDDLAAEVNRLLHAVQDWAKRFPEPERRGDERAAGGQCVPWCPICQFANLLRGEHPEITERVTEATNAIATAMKALADAALARTQGEPAPGARPRPAPKVEHIRLDDATEH